MTSRRQLLIDAVTLLASDAAVQMAHLDRLGVSPEVDELALEFDDIAAARDDMLEKGELSADEHRLVAMVDMTLVDMTAAADDALWTRDAVEQGGRWAELRRQAGECQRKLCCMQRGGG